MSGLPNNEWQPTELEQHKLQTKIWTRRGITTFGDFLELKFKDGKIVPPPPGRLEQYFSSPQPEEGDIMCTTFPVEIDVKTHLNKAIDTISDYSKEYPNLTLIFHNFPYSYEVAHLGPPNFLDLEIVQPNDEIELSDVENLRFFQGNCYRLKQQS